MLEALAVANKIRYLEVVQPTLNLVGAKDLKTKSEASLQCLTIDRPVVDAIRIAYSGTVGEILDVDSRNLLDSRYMFKNEKSRMFDDCVHLSPEGSRALSALIAKRLEL